MGRKKTTGELTERFSFALHPQYPEDQQAINIIKELTDKGYSVRQIMTDFILRCAGYTPEMFSSRDGVTTDKMENMLNRFATEIVSQFGQRGNPGVEPDEPQGDDSDMWVNNFAKGFLARQQQVLGEGDDD